MPSRCNVFVFHYLVWWSLFLWRNGRTDQVAPALKKHSIGWSWSTARSFRSFFRISNSFPLWSINNFHFNWISPFFRIYIYINLILCVCSSIQISHENPLKHLFFCLFVSVPNGDNQVWIVGCGDNSFFNIRSMEKKSLPGTDARQAFGCHDASSKCYTRWS